jgi:putative transposase
MIEPNNKSLSISIQCELLGLNRSSYYSVSIASTDVHTEDSFNLELMQLIDEEYMRHPFYGTRKMTKYINRLGYRVNRKRVQRLMRLMGIQSVAPKPNTSLRRKGHKIYPYLLAGLDINRINQVWSTDITYIKLAHGFVYLVAVIDWYSRQVLSWEVSNTMDEDFCVSALQRALRLHGTPEIFNTDQGVQFTGNAFTQVLKDKDIKISMDGKGRALDNIFIERLWRSVKYEEIYLHEYRDVAHLNKSLKKYFYFYNTERQHQSLDYRTPSEVHYDKALPKVVNG